MVHETTSLSPRRLRRRQARTREILAEAEALMRLTGLESVTIQGIADRLDWTKGALYRYFDSKDALIAALQRRVILKLRDRIGRRLAAKRLSPLAELLAVVEEYESFAEEEPAAFGLLTQSVADPRTWIDEVEAGAVLDAALELLGDLGRILEGAAQAGAIGCARPLEQAVQLWAALQGTLQLRKIGRLRPEAFPIPRLTRDLVFALLVGWGANPDELMVAWSAREREKAE